MKVETKTEIIMHRNKDYPAPSKKASKPAPSVPAMEDTTKAEVIKAGEVNTNAQGCLLYTSPSPRDGLLSRMPSSA